MPTDQDIVEDHQAFIMIKGVARIPSTGSNSNDKVRQGIVVLHIYWLIMRVRIHLP